MARSRPTPVPPSTPRPPVSPASGQPGGLPRWALAVVGGCVLTAIAWLWWPRFGPSADRRPIRASAPTAAVAPLEPQETVFARYAGSASCRECHEKESAAWVASNHGLAERPIREDLDRIAFDPPRLFVHASQTTEVAWNGGHPSVTATGLGERREPHAVARVIGHDPLRQFLVASPGGRWQTLEASWDPRTNEWFNVYGNEDRKPGEWGHWTGRGMNWNAMCGTCHNTRFRKNYDPAGDSYRTSMAEMTVGCEACHGPMKDHVSWQRAWKDSGRKDPTIVRFTPARHMETCAPCHARRSELTGDLEPGRSFWDQHLLSIVDESDVFHPDGQIRDEDYEYAPFLGSRMHAAGVTCLDCHDPHAARPKLAGNDLCMGCHNGSRVGSPLINPDLHGFHRPGTSGSACVDCHMPRTLYMQKHWRHDHGFTSPDPWLTKEYGIPNACNRCHADKDADWALAACEKWYGPRMQRPARSRASTFARARRGEASARDELVALLASTEAPYWKASALALLDPWMDAGTVREAALRQLTNDHPLVRYRAVQALAPRVDQGDRVAEAAVRQRLEDASRAVRFSAGWTLRATLDPESTAGREVAHTLMLNADQPTGQAQLAVYAASRGQPDRALGHYATAVAWDPGSAALRQDYAVALSQAGRVREALDQTREAARIQPDVAENHHRLGLAHAEVGDLDSAVTALERATRLDPRHDRAWYNLGLALNQRGEVTRAIEALANAEGANPRDARIPYARATILAQAGRNEEAMAAARRVLDLDPGNPAARELLRVLAP